MNDEATYYITTDVTEVSIDSEGEITSAEINEDVLSVTVLGGVATTNIDINNLHIDGGTF